MNAVTASTLSEAVTALGLKFQFGPDMPVVVRFRSEGADPDVVVLLHPTDSPLLCVAATIVQDLAEVPPDNLLAFCNEWNASHRWPTASIQPGDGQLKIWGETNFPFFSDPSDDTLRRALVVAIDLSLEFCRALVAFCESGFEIDDQELKDLLDETN